MIKVSPQQIEERRRTRPPEYWTDLAACPAITLTDEGGAEIDETADCYRALLLKWRPPAVVALPGSVTPAPWHAAPSQPLGRESWPMLARLLAKRAKPGDAGLGDVVQRLAAKMGGEWYKAVRKKIGFPCRCVADQRWLNARFPL